MAPPAGAAAGSAAASTVTATDAAPPPVPRGGRTATVAASPPHGGPSDDLLALDRQVCFALAVAAREVVGLYGPILEPLGLTHPQYLVMLALWEREPLRVRTLADTLSLEPATVSPVLKRLEAKGLLTRSRDPRDERALSLRLTPAGRELREEATAVPHAVLERLGTDVAELERLRDGLHRLIAATRPAPDPD